MPEQLSGDREALRLAWDEASARSLSALAEGSGAEAGDEGVIRLQVMDRVCVVDLRSRDITYADDGSKVKPHIQVLVLHYVLGAVDAEPTGEMVTFREFPGGALYFPAYKKRTLDILVSRFGGDPELLKRASERLGAASLDRAAVGFRTMFFPKLAVDTLMWAGDDEVPSSANILFDSCAERMLSTEDVTVVAGALCSRLIALSKG
jgi:hypothetical protein